MSFIEPTFKKIILELYQKERLTKDEIAAIIEPQLKNFPSETKKVEAYRSANAYARFLEKANYAIRFSHKGRDYTLQITKKGKEAAKKLKAMKNESS
ncbi:MAG: hypothetical protein QXQ69_00800 [Candidatus Aenigmatarchaeota archaeon]